jgi:dihydrodipicolinate synthase/N-acetylneuraminate lyase
MSKKLSVIVVSTTPFDAQGRLDEAMYRRHLGRLRDAGVTVYVGGGGSGEGYTLSHEERDRVLAIAVEELKGKVPVRAMGCEPRLASEMVDYLRAAERAKVDAAQIFSLEIGHAAKPTVPEMDLYYSTALGSTSIPCVISTHQTVGYFVPVDLLENLARRFPNLTGVAYGGGDTTYIAELIARLGDRLEIHCAGPFNAVNVLTMGGNGFMGGEGNFCPTLVASVISSWQKKDTDTLRESFSKLIRFAATHNPYGGSSAVRSMKPLMNAFGMPGGHVRPPRVAIPQTEVDKLVQAVLKLNIPGVPPLPVKG